MHRFITLTTALTLTIIAGPSWAQTVNAEGAAGIKTAITAGLPMSPNFNKDVLEYRWTGESRVVPAGDHYDVTLPALALVADSEKKTQFDVGVIQLKLTPKSDATYTIDVTFPNRMTLRKGDAPTATVTIGKQRFTGLWSSAVQNLLTADMAWDDLAVATSAKGKQDRAARIASVTLKQNLQPAGPDLWSGPSNITLGKVTLTDQNKKTVLTIGEVGVDAEYNRINLAKGVQLKEMIKTQNTASTPLVASQALPVLGAIFGDISMTMRVGALSVGSDKDGGSINKASFSMGLRNLDGETSTFSLGFMGDGLKVSPFPGPKQFMPERFEVKLALDKLPNAAFGQTILELAKLAEQEKPGDNSGAAMQELMKKALDAAGQAGTELRIEQLTLDTPATSGSVTGAAQVKTQAAFNAAGGAEIVLRGLDAAAAALKKDAKADQQAVGVISMLQMLGQQGKNAEGKEVRIYKLELTEAGQIMLNGADMSAMMGLGGPAAADEEEEGEGVLQPEPAKN